MIAATQKSSYITFKKEKLIYLKKYTDKIKQVKSNMRKTTTYLLLNELGKRFVQLKGIILG